MHKKVTEKQKASRSLRFWHWGRHGLCLVSRWAYERRSTPAPSTPRIYLQEDSHGQLERNPIRPSTTEPGLPVVKRLIWLFLLPVEKLDEEEVKLRQGLLNHTVLQQAWQLLIIEIFMPQILVKTREKMA